MPSVGSDRTYRSRSHLLFDERHSIVRRDLPETTRAQLAARAIWFSPITPLGHDVPNGPECCHDWPHERPVQMRESSAFEEAIRESGQSTGAEGECKALEVHA